MNVWSTVKVMDLIREIDPDYTRCNHCKRLRHKSQTKRMVAGVLCADRGECVMFVHMTNGDKTVG